MLSSHTGEGGVTWTQHASFTVGTFTIENNRVSKDGSANSAVYYASVVSPSLFCEISCTITDKSALARTIGVFMHIDTASDTMLGVRRFDETTWQFLKIINNVGTTIDTAPETFSAEASHTLRLRRIPETNDFEWFLDNVSQGVFTVNDAEFQSIGKVGIRATGGAGGPTIGFHLDNLSATSLTAPNALFRGRNFSLFDDEEVNRFEFWPAIAAASDLPLTLSDDAFNLSDALVQEVEYRVSLSDDANVLADSEAGLLAHLLPLSDDAASLDDSTLLNLEHRIPLADDTSTLTDAYAQQLNEVVGVIDLPLSDSFTLTDSLSLGHGLVIAESAANFDDAESNELGQLTEFNDTLLLSDSLALTTTYLTSFDDALLLADSESISLGYDESFSDAISLTDAESNQLDQLLEFSDVLSLNDAQASLLAHLLSTDDSLTLTDSAAFLMTHLLALDDDANLLLDFLQTDSPQGPSILIGLTDALTLSDSIQLQFTHQLTLSDNAANWADSLTQTLSIALILSDNAASLTDAHTALMTHLLQVVDALTLTDSLATFGESYLQVDDSLALTDDADVDLRGPDVNLALDDSLVLTDAVTISLNNEFQYQIVLTDTITLYDHYFDLRHPYTPSAKRHVVVPSRARVTVVPASDRETVPTG